MEGHGDPLGRLAAMSVIVGRRKGRKGRRVQAAGASATQVCAPLVIESRTKTKVQHI